MRRRDAIVTRYDGELLHLAAQHNQGLAPLTRTTKFFPQVPRRDINHGARSHRCCGGPRLGHQHRGNWDRRRARHIVGSACGAVIAVPMVYEGRPIGVVSVSRGTPGPFSGLSD